MAETYIPTPTAPVLEFEAIRLRVASPETVRAWSHGEVTKPETINYRTQKPEKDGLFDERIFGPTKDWECYCGKYKKIRYKGIVCDKCGVEVTHSLVRRERMGHIELAAPTSHIWFLRGVPSKIGLCLDLSVMNLEKVIYFANFVVTDVDEPGKAAALDGLRSEYKGKRKQIEHEAARELERNQVSADDPRAESTLRLRDSKQKELEEEFVAVERDLKSLQPLAIISEQTYHEWSLRFGHLFHAGIGAEAVYKLLKKVNLRDTIALLAKEVDASQGPKRERILRRMKLLRSLELNGIRPEWMILTVIPVIPPDLRPMVALDGGRFATSDLNDLYRRVINRNNRLKRLVELNAPEVIVRNEKRMLQEAVDALIDNSARQSKTVLATTGKKRQLKSLADIFKGKQGRFRQNLLGKRTDYSGRSVIVVGPELLIHQCGLPKKMALELFRPFVISKLIGAGLVHNIRGANRYIEADHPEVWDILEDITRDSLVLLNRAPTLHRLGIQAFQPLLIEGKAIRIHPMVCKAFNADFDGDQMAVHIPLTEDARREARELMLASRNLLKPATGSPVATPDKDVVWGCYYLTMQGPEESTVPVFASEKQALYAYEIHKLGLNRTMSVRLDGEKERTQTTIGRVIFNRVLPEDIPYQNEKMDTKKLNELIRYILEIKGQEVAAATLDALKLLGFTTITRSGFSWGMAELPDVHEKKALVEDGDRRVAEILAQWNEGLLTLNERHTKIIEVWTEVKDRIQKISKEKLPKEGSVYTMMDSGARGSPGQLTQMIGMKGLVSSPAGDIIELPVKAGFKEGFDVLEYFISTHGTRKGLSDTALRTANAGYLTRRLVDVSQDVVISAEDCGDEEGIVITAKESDEMGEPLAARVLGRFVIEPIKDAVGKKTFVKAGELVTEPISRDIAKADVVEARVRSVLKCRLVHGICVKCYGYDLAYNKVVGIGVATGIIAAQSIGEPGTQLTMRTFHTGGVAGLDITQGLPRVEELFEARTPKRRALVADVGGAVAVEEGEHMTVNEKGETIAVPPGHKLVRIAYAEERVNAEGVKERAEGTKDFVIPPGYVILVRTGQTISAGDAITEGDLDLQQLYTLKGKAAVQKYIMKDIQSIYTSQGQKLNDKHIEIIVRQMFSRVLVKEEGGTDMLPGEVVERAEFETENRKAAKAKKKPAVGQELFLGISKVALSTQSFLSAASFQETARVLINAAVTGKVDPLAGLKENVIIGRLIPAGTGYKPRKEV